MGACKIIELHISYTRKANTKLLQVITLYIIYIVFTVGKLAANSHPITKYNLHTYSLCLLVFTSTFDPNVVFMHFQISDFETHVYHYSLLTHTSLRSWYRTLLWLAVSFDLQMAFVVADDPRELSMIAVKGELNSSSSSSLVFDFLRIDPLRVSWVRLTPSPSMCLSEDADGG